jgi:CHAT domain
MKGALSGLARAFIYAGARALLVSHWGVSSEATVSLITGAVDTISRDKKVGRAEALRRAMLTMIDKGKPHEAHPAYWAPFVVGGRRGGREVDRTYGGARMDSPVGPRTRPYWLRKGGRFVVRPPRPRLPPEMSLGVRTVPKLPPCPAWPGADLGVQAMLLIGEKARLVSWRGAGPGGGGADAGEPRAGIPNSRRQAMNGLRVIPY